jgi:phage protein D
VVILLKPDKPKDEAFIKVISNKIKTLSFEDSDSGKDFLKLELDNSDLALLNEVGFLDATSFYIQWGNINNMTPLRKINIKKISGFLTLTVEGTGVLWKQDQEAIKKHWDNQNISDIVKKIAKEMGFERPDIQEPEAYYFSSFQQYEPNSRFLARLAREVGYSFWVDDNLHWKAADLKGASVLSLVFRGTSDPSQPGCIIGEPTVKWEFTREQPAQIIAVATVDKTVKAGPSSNMVNAVTMGAGSGTKTRSRYSMTAYGTLVYNTDTEKKAATFGEQKELPRKQKDTVYTPTGKPQKAAGAWRGKQSTSEIEVKIRGVGYIRLGSIVTCFNFGSINEGKWYIKKIKHEVNGSDGFTQSLTLTRTAAKKAGADAKTVLGKVNKTSTASDLFGPPMDEFREEEKLVTDANGTVTKVMRKVPNKPDGVTKQFIDYWGGYPK